MSGLSVVPLKTKLGFGVGQLSEGMITITFGLFVLFFYTQLLGIPGYYTGFALFVALIVDAVSDPWVGVVSDHWHSKWGRRHPFMLFAAIPLSISFYFLFSPPALLLGSDLGLALWLAAFAILTRVLLTFFEVPYLSLGAELSQDYRERTALVGFRYAFSNVGVILAIAIGFGFFFVPTQNFVDGQMNPAAYPPFALVLGIVITSSILACVIATWHVIPNLQKPPPKVEGVRVGSIAQLFLQSLGHIRVALDNYSFRWLAITTIIAFVAVGIVNSLTIYMTTFFWELEGSEIALVSSSIFIGILLGVFLTPYLHLRWDKKDTTLYAVVGWACFLVLPTTLRLLGYFPANGTNALFWVLLGFRVLEGLCLVQAAVSFGSMLADIADEHALTTGKREEGIFFGASSFASKCSDGLGTLVAGVALDLMRFPTGTDIASGDVHPDMLWRLGVLYGPLMLVFIGAALWCCNHYALDREKHQEILEKLANKAV